MRRVIVLSLLLAPVATRAQTLQLSGDLTGGYSRSDSGGEGVAHSDATSWDGGARLSLAGSPFRPGLADLLLSSEYRYFRSVYDSGGSRTRVLALRSDASLLGTTAVPLHLGASRSYTDFLTDLNADRTGRSVVTSVAGTAVVRTRDYPMLSASVSRTDVDTTSPDGSTSLSDTTRLSLGASQSAGAHRYALAYDTGWDHGTFAQNNYRSHQLLLDYDGAFDTTRFHLTERYYLRLPTVADRTNPRSDDNNLATGVQWKAFGDGNASFGYDYRHATLRGEGTPDLELLSHAVSQRVFVPWGTSLSLQGQIGASYGYERRGEIERRAAAENVGFDVSWNRPLGVLTVYAGGGSSVGLVEAEGAPLSMSLGLTGSGGLRAPTAPFSPSGTYSFAYLQQGADLSGWSLQQRLDLSGQAFLRSRVHLRAMLTLSDFRREDTVLGSSELRSANLLVSASFRRSSVQLATGASESLGAGIATPGRADGGLAPAELATRTWYATLTATRFSADGRFSLTAVARTLDVDAPGRPEQWEHGASLLASMSIGRFVMSAEDRVSLARAAGGSRYANLVYVTLTRSFGTRIL